MAGGGSRALWFVGDGEGRSSPWLVVVTCEWVCHRGHLSAVVEFIAVGSDVVGARCCSCWCRGGISHGARVVMSPYEFTSKTHSLSTEDLGKIFIH